MAAILSLQLQTLTPSSLAGRAVRLSRAFPTPLLHGRRRRAGGLVSVKAGFEPPFLFVDEASIGAAKEVWERVEGVLYTVADAAVNSEVVGTAGVTTKQSGDWLSGITEGMETVLKILKGGLSGLHVPYSYGFAIILLTVIVKAVTFPLSKKQVESAMAVRSLQPQIQAIQKRYAGDQERIQIETARLYKLAGVNPLAGCLPTLATIPVWIGLYRALSNVANEGLLTEGFFWIPSLSGPTTIAAKQSGSGISWLFPFVDGHPPLGWSDTFAYLVLPLLLVVSQYVSIQIMQSVQPTDPNQKTSQVLTKFLPLMIGYFALSVPSGLSLYWLTNNILSTAQQVWLQKYGGAKVPILQLKETLQKEPPLKAQKTVSDNLDIADQKVKETRPSGGPLPGERFKQIKEQEAKRKRELEEKKRAEEASNQLVAEEEKRENLSTTITHEVERVAVVNGSTSSEEAIEDKQSASETSTSATINAVSRILEEEISVESHTSKAENGSVESGSYRSNEPSDKNKL